MRYDRTSMAAKLREIADDIESGSIVKARYTYSQLPTTYTNRGKQTGITRSYKQTLNNVIVEITYQGEIYGA